VLLSKASSAVDRLRELLRLLGERRMTNVMIEGGSGVLSSCFEGRLNSAGSETRKPDSPPLVDEAWVFIAPKVVGGEGKSPILGSGAALMKDSLKARRVNWHVCGEDMLCIARF
jgi:diaminohydroxyphosphoribosylaminopyrimidine deaminase / 5-amino-6-(5-phosphoribosylamino)uracil reductase